MVLSLNRIRFWSADPPLTLNPAEASPTLFTPGSVRTAFNTSPSPNAVGTFLRVLAPILSIPSAAVR